MRIKKIYSILMLTCIHAGLFAQKEDVVHFDVVAKESGKGVYNLIVTGKISGGWHLYDANSENGIDPFSISFDYENIANSGKAETDHTTENISDQIFDNKKLKVYTGIVSFTQRIKITGAIPSRIKGKINAYFGKGDQFIPEEQYFEVDLAGGTVNTTFQSLKIASVDINNPIQNCGNQPTAETAKENGLLSIFFIGFLGGLIALLTPCVFPMIPVTVSFFTKRSESKKQGIKNGILYGSFILLIYVMASIPFHVLGNVRPEMFNNISTNPVLNIIFFVIFIVFAISFFGFFEITLSSKIASKADAKSGLGSMGGIFFMALTLAIVSFSCTGPILGSLLVGSLSGGAWPLTAGLAGFGLALALPFALFAIFPNWLASLPKSGGWLDTVKKVLAFIELALAFKFLSNADLVMHWGIIKREIFFAIWILIGAGLTLYLFGFLRLPHDYKGMKIGKGRKIAGVLAALFTIYLIPGVTQTKTSNLKLMSGFPPPLSYSIYGKDNARGKVLEPDVINDYAKALQMARAQNKMLLIDFTGWACVNCRKMEENVWIQPEVYQYIKANFILVSLYVDDKQKLPAEQRINSYKTKDGSVKDITTLGDKWATFQAENVAQVTQPLYVIINAKEQLVNTPIGYTPDVKKYVQWMECGNRKVF